MFHIIVCFIFFYSFSVSFFFFLFKILFIFSSLSIVYLNHEIKFTNIFCLFFLVASCVLQDLPEKELNLKPLQQKCRVLSTGPPGKSQLYSF